MSKQPVVLTQVSDLDENEVVDAVKFYLAKKGYKIDKFCNNTQKGTDIEASKDENKVVVEAKGARSCRKGSPRFESGFDTNQIVDRIAKGILKVMELRAKYPNYEVVLAVPDYKKFKAILTPLLPQLTLLGIQVYIVDAYKQVAVL